MSAGPVGPPVGPQGVPEVDRRALRAVFGATFFVRFAFGITLAVFASYIASRSIGIDSSAVGTIGLVSALAPVGEFSTVLLSGVAADRYGRFRVLFAGTVTAAVLMAVVSATRNPVLLGAANLVFGVASGAILAASLAVVADRAEVDHRGLAMGQFDAVNLLGWILGFAAGFAALGTLSNAALSDVFLGSAVLLAVGFLFAWRTTRGDPEGTGNRVALDIGFLLRTAVRRDVLIVTLPWLVIYLLLGTLFVFLGTAATGAGIPPLLLAAVIGIGGSLLLVTQPLFGRMADRYGRFRLMGVGTVGFVGVLAGAGWLATAGFNYPAIAVLAASVLPALAYGPAALAALADLSRALSRGTTMAIYTLTIALGMLIGLLVSTALYSRFGATGLDAYFGGIAVALVGLTLVRYHDLRAGHGTSSEAHPAPPAPPAA
ncbi:MAG TPA: MFS transporter [Thermoplasmata archaeon]|nr:MFS transporter [Thermoplasmata archaeon]